MDWTVVRHKRGLAVRSSTARARHLPSNETKSADAHLLSFRAPTPESQKLKRDTSQHSCDNREEEEELLMDKMQRAVAKVERSVFFSRFMKQVQNLEVVENLKRSRRPASGVSGEQPEAGDDMCDKDGGDLSQGLTVELVVYGVGSISNSEISRCQLSLALLLKRRSVSIGNILVYDPIMSASDRSVMLRLGCSPLEDNEEGRRAPNGPTLFYMPHCDVELYESVLQANLRAFCVDQLVILGNSFRNYQERWSVRPLPHGERPSCLLMVQPSVEEIPVGDGFSPTAFNDTSWHLFSKIDVSKLS